MNSPWFFRPRPNPAAALSLFCFHHAGVGASAFRMWPAHLPADIDVCAVQLPGREGRLRDPAYHTLDAALPAVVAALQTSLDRPYVLFGHSMGALFAFETARALSTTARPASALIVSGRRAPHLVATRPRISHLEDTPFLDAVSQRYGGIPPQIREEPEIMALLLPTLRADLRIVEDYRYREGPALACPLFACGGATDAEAPPDTVTPWSAYTNGKFRAASFPGGHFYWQSDVPRFCREVGDELQRWGILPGGA